MKILTKPSFEYEKRLWKTDIKYVIGIDEVGRGAFAGPIVAAAVVFSSNAKTDLLCDVNDSKLVKPQERERCAKIIKKHALLWAIEQIDISYINKFGIGKANNAVFRRVLNNIITRIGSANYSILIDGFHKKYLPGGIKKQQGIIKGDQKSLTIASASILAKVYRDSLMQKQSLNFPNYNFASNKGYGTKAHREALEQFGLTSIHRTSFNLSKFL